MDLPLRLLRPALKHVACRLADVALILLLLWATWALWLQPAIDHEIAHAKQEARDAVSSSIRDAATSAHLPWSKP